MIGMSTSKEAKKSGEKDCITIEHKRVYDKKTVFRMDDNSLFVRAMYSDREANYTYVPKIPKSFDHKFIKKREHLKDYSFDKNHFEIICLDQPILMQGKNSHRFVISSNGENIFFFRFD